MTAAIAGAVRGRPSNSALSDSLDRARQVNVNLRDELRAERLEGRLFAEEVRAYASRIDLAVRADRPDLALHLGASIVALADRRLRQLGGIL